MADEVINPEFPDYCRIYRERGITSFTPDDPFSSENLDGEGFPIEIEEEEVVYAGPCRRETSDNIRSFQTGTTTVGRVSYADYRISLPGSPDIRKGDLADVDYPGGRDRKVTVLRPNRSRLLTAKYPQGRTEFYYNHSDV